MNREIKFRAWHFGLKKMFSAEEMANDQMTLLPTGRFINVNGVHTNMSKIYSTDEMLPLQYTGLHDKNGVEIYEGDIVLGSYGIPGRTIKSDVVYDKSAFMVMTPEHGSKKATLHMLLHYLGGDLEIIGNIYENPELLDAP